MSALYGFGFIPPLVALVAGCANPEPEPETPAVAAPEVPVRLVINEVAAAGTPSDWFEVVNASEAPIALAGFVYVDRERDVARAHRFPDVTLAPHELHVEIVSRGSSGFALGKADGLWIYSADNHELVDAVRWSAGASPRGGSYARLPNVAGAHVTVRVPTRGLPNPAEAETR